MNRIFLVFCLTALVSHSELHGQQDGPTPQQNATPSPSAETVTNAAATNPPSQNERRSRRRRHNPREVVAIGNNARLKEGEEVDQVVVIHGNAEIDGKVNGDVVVILGRARLGPKALVNGDVTVVAGALEADPAAQIIGSPTVVGPNISFLGDGLERAAWWIRWPAQWFHHGLLHGRAFPLQFSWSWLAAGLTLVLYLLVALLFPRMVQNTVGMLNANPGRALGAGVLGLVALPALCLLLLFTVVGVFIMPLVLVSVAVFILFGKVALYRYAGQQLGSALGWTLLQKPLLALVAGALGFYLLYAVPLLGLIVWLAALVLGLGAVLLTIFKRETKPVMAPQAVPVPPPSISAAEGSPAAVPVVESAALLPRAGFWIRLLATLLDAVLVGLIMGLLLHRPRWFLLVWVAYHIVFWSWKGTTVGGIIVGLRIVRLDGRPINFAVALVRCLASFFSLAVVGLGFLWAGWSQDKQSWHDKIAGTIVVKNPKGTPLV
jgi:uncharacterized RDD family membrane protein YckC